MTITELLSDYVMHFTKSGTTDYVAAKGPAKDLLQVSRKKIGTIITDTFHRIHQLSPVVRLPMVAIDGHLQLWHGIVVCDDVS